MPIGVLAVLGRRVDGFTNVEPCGPATIASPSAEPDSSWFQDRNHSVQPLSQVPGRGLPVIVIGSPGTASL